MPVGDPKPQTIATKKYEKKAGFLSKSYKLKRDVVEQFAETCEKAGVSQASQLTKMMTTFACKKDVEREYVMQKQQLDNSVIQIQSAISALRKMQDEVAEESVQDEMGIIIDSLLDAKDKGLKAMKENETKRKPLIPFMNEGLGELKCRRHFFIGGNHGSY